LVVGNTMRNVTDKLKISREKLSYIVDSTAAPVTAIAFVTTWIGAELGYIDSAIATIPEIKSGEGVYSIFVNSLQYAFYPVFALIFILILVLRNRDFGPMYKAEIRVRTTGQVSASKEETGSAGKGELESMEPVKNAKPKSLNAVLPVLVIIAGTLAGLFYTGTVSCREILAASGILDANASLGTVWSNLQFLPKHPEFFFQKLGTIIGASDSYSALLWSSLGGLILAIVLTVVRRIMSLSQTVDAAIKGFKTMLNAILILVLAWSLALLSEQMHTADFLTGVMGDHISPWALPALSFILAAIVSFSTGSSWGTMAILYPLVLPAAWKVCQISGYDFNTSMMIFYNVVSTVLAGSVLGDHCSPISDTTILSSLASSCNHIDHVKTQLPYAATVGGVALVFGTIPGAFGISPLILFPAGIVVMFLIIQLFGKRLSGATGGMM
ncbi:MAG: Na+/H+ antiporter NhaC family protein, partial [Bacteroidetes bacterium]|nr:Na+/H+ antiporter NhaC family protein [Bacteroidota bacterium]